MDINIAQKRVNDLAAAMVAKGMRNPDAQFWVKANAQPCVYLNWEVGINGGSYIDRTKSQFVRGDTFEDALEKASEFIAAQPDAETAKLNEFLSSLGKVIDMGREYAIDSDYLNPLVASMKKLSENVITDRRDTK